MPVDPGIGTHAPARGSQRFFQRWGIKGQLRSIWNTVLPVAVVDHYRSEDLGSHRALTVQCNGNINQYPTCMLVNPGGRPGTADIIIEVDRMNGARLTNAAGANQQIEIHIFSPSVAYNPVLNLNPIGLYLPGLTTHPSNTWGQTVGIAGTNPALSPDPIGYVFEKWIQSLVTANWWYSNHNQVIRFDPPIRLYPGHALAYQWRHKEVAASCYLFATFLYREYPEE